MTKRPKSPAQRALNFSQLFRFVDKDTLEFKIKVKSGRIIFNKGARVPRGILLGGINFFRYPNAEITGHMEGDAFVIEYVYPNHG